MNIGIDARPLQAETQYRGIGKALSFFLETLAQQKTTLHSFVFYVDIGLPQPPILDAFPERQIKAVGTSRLGRLRYVRSVLPSYKRLRPDPADIDVLLQYDAYLGIPLNVPTVVIFYDLIPLLFRKEELKQAAKAAGLRKLKNNLAGWLYWQKYLRVLRSYKKATRIITISDASRRDLLQHTDGIDPDKVSTVYLGVRKEKVTGAVSQEIREIIQLPYLLYVGGIDYRKNIIQLLPTFFELKADHADLRLVTVGKEFGLDDQLGDLGWFRLLEQHKSYAEDVIRPGYLSEHELQDLYTHAACFVFPSRYEGFGLPVLEAMQAGCPIVAYDNSSMPEVAGNAALLVKDGQPLTQAVWSILTDENLRQKLIKDGKTQADSFNWGQTVEQTLTILEKAAVKR